MYSILLHILFYIHLSIVKFLVVKHLTKTDNLYYFRRLIYKYMKFILKNFTGIITAWILLVSTCNAQSINILVKDDARLPLIGATIQLTLVADSSILYATTAQNGIAKFNEVKNGLYFLKISYVGFKSLEKNISIKTDRRMLEFQLKETEISLNEVTVTARRPMITQEDDKMIIDPEPMANSSTNTLEVLESTPGLYVDQDGNIFLNGASPAKIYINSREQKMSTEDISTILRSLPPGSVQRIEVMRTPSTKYDASSTGGIVNVILKKGVKIGRFMSFNIGMNQGVYGNRFGGFTYNNSTEKSTSYVNVNFNRNDAIENLNSTRYINSDTVLNQINNIRNTRNQAYIGYGLAYDINPNLNFSYDGRINGALPVSSSKSTNLVETIEKISLLESDNQNNFNSSSINIQQDFGLNYKIDTIGSNWDNKFSFNSNFSNSKNDYNNTYIFPISFKIFGDGKSLQNRYFIQFQSDLTYQFAKKFKIETGIKSSFQKYTSNNDYFITLNNNRTNDASRTNSYNYTENINAAYAQASKTFFWDFLLKVGVRMEHTYMNGNQQIPSDTSFVVNRVDFFPYIYLSRPLFKVANFELRAYLIYRKTINRPDYQSLTPYLKFINEFEYETGNPNLKPQFTDNIEMNISIDDMPLFAIGQNFTTDIFSNVVYRYPANENITLRTFDNIGKSKETYFRAMAGIPPGKIYFFGLGGQYNLNEYDGVYQNQPLKYTRGSWQFFTFHSLTIMKNTKITMFGFMMVNGKYNFYELDTFGSLNFGINQTFLNKKLTISLNARDVLRTMVTQFSLNQGSVVSNGSRYADNQRFGINIRYNFGISKKDNKKNPMGFEQEDKF